MIGTFGRVQSAAPSFKVFGNTLYPNTEKGLFTSDVSISLPVATIGEHWGDVALSKAALVANTESFFQTPKFEKVAQLAASDASFTSAATGHGFAISRSRGGLDCTPAPKLPQFSPSLSRFTLLLNPPAFSKFGVNISNLSGGTETDRATYRPYKLTLTHAGSPTLAQEVTMWPSDAKVIFGDVSNLAEHLKTTTAILLVSGSASSDRNGVEYTVRAGAASANVEGCIAIKSEVLKSLFNEVAHDPKLALAAGAGKSNYVKSLEAILDEGRTVPLIAWRASSADDLLVDNTATLKLVRGDAHVDTNDVAETIKLATIVKYSTDAELTASIEALDSVCTKVPDLDSARGKLNELLALDDKECDNRQISRAIVALHALESLDKHRAQELAPLLKRAEPSDESEYEDDEDLAPEGNPVPVGFPEEESEEEEDLCAGL